MWWPRRHGIERAVRFGICGKQAIELQQIGQGEHPETRAGFLQEIAPITERLIAPTMMIQ
jgi:hypothetical protein